MIYLGNSPVGVAVGLPGLLEIVDFVTPSEDTYSISFTCDKSEGEYIVVSNPPGNYETAAQQSQSETISMCAFIIRGLDTKTFGGSTVTARKTPTSSNKIDWWTASFTETDDGFTVNFTQSRMKAYAGFTYYLIKVKGM